MYNVGISVLCRVLVYCEGENALNPCSVTPELLSEKAIASALPLIRCFTQPGLVDRNV